MVWVEAGSVEQFSEAEATIVSVEGREIGIFLIDGQWFALLNHCTHAGAPICLGRVGTSVRSDGPGTRPYVVEGKPTIRCPWHHWEFQLASGESVPPVTRPRLRVYPVEQRGSTVWVDA